MFITSCFKNQVIFGTNIHMEGKGFITLFQSKDSMIKCRKKSFNLQLNCTINYKWFIKYSEFGT